MMKHQSGFTLIELLVVLAIVAIMLPAGYQLLGLSTQAKTVVETHVQENDDLYRLMDLLQSDIEASLDRDIRSELGVIEQSLVIQGSKLALTRAGWDNPTQQTRSQMQRVQYQMVEGELVREFWDVLDRDVDSTSRSTSFASINSFSAKVLTKSGWLNSWPSISYLAGDTANLEAPAALMISISTNKGSVERIFEIPRISALKDEDEQI